MLTRRRLLGGALAAPVVIMTPGLLMPVRAIEPIDLEERVWRVDAWRNELNNTTTFFVERGETCNTRRSMLIQLTDRKMTERNIWLDLHKGQKISDQHLQRELDKIRV